jgi:hypothetical protein
VNARFTDDEYAELVTAADLAGLAPTGSCAQAALDTARALNTVIKRAEYQTLGALQAELFQARLTINQLRGGLSGHLDRSNTGNHDEIIARTRRSVGEVDDVISRIHRLIGDRRWADNGSPAWRGSCPRHRPVDTSGPHPAATPGTRRLRRRAATGRHWRHRPRRRRLLEPRGP